MPPGFRGRFSRDAAPQPSPLPDWPEGQVRSLPKLRDLTREPPKTSPAPYLQKPLRSAGLDVDVGGGETPAFCGGSNVGYRPVADISCPGWVVSRVICRHWPTGVVHARRKRRSARREGPANRKGTGCRDRRVRRPCDAPVDRHRGTASFSCPQATIADSISHAGRWREVDAGAV